MKSYRDYVMRGFCRGLTVIINRKTQYQILYQLVEHWVTAGTQNRPLQIGPVVVARVERDIVIYSWRHAVGVPIPDVVWKVWPRNILGGRI